MVAEGLKKARFGCQIGSCLGECCVDGESGGPLTEAEARWIESNRDEILPQMDGASKAQVLRDGLVSGKKTQLYTPLLGRGGPCVYSQRDAKGVSICLFEKQFLSSKLEFQKPLSCHLYPLIYKETRFYKSLNYERRGSCLSSWHQGELLVKFAEKALVRQFGLSFTRELLSIVEQA